jgi:hypothetical protein
MTTCHECGLPIGPDDAVIIATAGPDIAPLHYHRPCYDSVVARAFVPDWGQPATGVGVDNAGAGKRAVTTEEFDTWHYREAE